MLLKDNLYLCIHTCRESEHYYSHAFSANETMDQMMEHQYAEVTACKTEYDVIECKSLSIKSSEYEDMAAYRNSAHTCTDYELSECPACIMTTPTAKKGATDDMPEDEIYI